MDFDPSQGHILIWQPPLPPETTMLVPNDPTAEQVDLRAPAPPSDPPCWLTEEYFEGEHAAPKADHVPVGDAHQHRLQKDQAEQPDGRDHTVEMLANLVAANAMLEFTRNLGRKKEEERAKLPEKEDEEKK
jgi:hypothetical protein